MLRSYAASLSLGVSLALDLVSPATADALPGLRGHDHTGVTISAAITSPSMSMISRRRPIISRPIRCAP